VNYPFWDVPAPGLFIAVIAIVHVFVSHFAVGGVSSSCSREARTEDRRRGFLDFLRRISKASFS